MTDRDLLLEIVNRIGVLEFEKMSNTDDRFVKMKLKDGEFVFMRIDTPQRENFCQEMMSKVKESK